MSKRIGETLIDRGVLTEAQLEKAIKAQLIFGGHLGTSLIELGYVDESSLGETLAELFHVNYAPFELLQDIPQPVLDLVPASVVEKHKVVPIKQIGKTLHLAVIDPKDLAALDEISFVTACKVVPWVTPEVRIFQAMEKYYELPRRARYITICRELDRRISRANPQKPEQEAHPVARAGEGSSTVDAPAAPLADPGEPEFSDGLDENYGYGKSWQDVLEEATEERSDAPDESWTHSHDEIGHDEFSETQSLDETAQLLARAESKDDLARSVLAYEPLARGRSILFKVKGTNAFVWESNCLDLSGDALATRVFPVVSGSIFELLLGENCYRGPIPGDGQYRWFYNALQMRVPNEILVVPVHLNDRLIAIIYSDNGPDGGLDANTDEFLRLAGKLSLAMNMVLVKRKILAL